LSHQRVLDAKGSASCAVIIPARDEESTIGGVLEAVLPHQRSGLLDELIVVDDGSSDATAEVAAREGVTVLRRHGGGGKGAAMAAGVEASSSELLLFLDGDVENTTEHFVPRMLGPLLLDPELMLVKAFYERPFGDEPTGGGRVTELTARPALAVLYPELAQLRQPLAGETATRRLVVEKVGLEPGYRVEMGLLIDVALQWGAASIAEVDLGVRIHRNRPLVDLAPMAREILAVALERAAGAQL